MEITLTEDFPRDIQAALGRSNHRSIEALRERNKKVAEGNAEPRFSSLSGNVLNRVVERIEAKLLNCYVANSSLVVCDISGVDWDWDIVIQALLEKLDLKRNPFDKGIWIVNRYKTKLYAVIEGGV